MPNLKVYVDDRFYRDTALAFATTLDPIRACIIHHLTVPEAACQICILSVIGLPDQALVNVELQILPHPTRTRTRIETLGKDLQTIIATATGVRPNFRCMQHDPASYVTLK